MVRTQVQITEQQAVLLRRRAAEEGTSQAEIVRRSIELYLRASGTVADQERRQRALSASGRFRSGKRDLAERHDKYLAQVYAS